MTQYKKQIPTQDELGFAFLKGLINYTNSL